jgi:hypothetical protein
VFDGSTLVPAYSEARVPVCCVEQGRWDGSARHERFRSSSQVAHPELRSAMAAVRSAATGRTDQNAVWTHVAERVRSADVRTATGAMSDVYLSRRASLDEAMGSVRLRPRQRGMLVLAGRQLVALDWLASPEAWADAHPRLVRGYALDGLERSRQERVPTRKAAAEVLDVMSTVSLEPAPTRGAGRRLYGPRPVGPAAPLHATALELDGRLVHLSVLGFVEAA